MSYFMKPCLETLRLALKPRVRGNKLGFGLDGQGGKQYTPRIGSDVRLARSE